MNSDPRRQRPLQSAQRADAAMGIGPARRTRVVSFLADFLRCEAGAVAIIAGLAIPVLLGFTGLALEYGQILVVRSEAQRAADLASHAGAVAYARTGDTAAMTNAAQGVARLNGFSDTEIILALDTSVTTANGAAVRATITTPKPLYLPQLLGGDASVNVVATAVAGAMGGAPSCVQALDPNGDGISLSGGTSLEAAGCAVASNAAVDTSCGTTIVTKTLSYDAGAAPNGGGCKTVVAPDGSDPQISRRPTSDPLAQYAAVLRAADQMASTAALSAPDDVNVAKGPDIDFGWKQKSTQKQAKDAGCDAAFARSEWTFTCPGLATVNLGDITIGGGLRLRFNPGAPRSVIYNFSGQIENNGDRMTFAGGVYNVERGITTGGGSVTEFGAGTYRIGRSNQNCSGARYSICNTSQLTFDGPSDFNLPGGIRNGNGSTLTLGTGTGNSFRFGPSTRGDAVVVGGGGQLLMGDVSNGGVFEAVGQIDSSGGGSCLVLPAADLHEIRGSVVASGAVRFGAGVYAIDGFLHLGANGGGSATCAGETLSIEALGATFLIAANGSQPNGGQCKDQAFCVTSGYSDVQFTAPQSGPFTDLAVIGPLDPSRRAGTLFAAGASGSQISGALYFPNGAIKLSGGASASDGGDGCLQLIGAAIIMSGGTSAVSECDLPQSGGSGRVLLLR